MIFPTLKLWSSPQPPIEEHSLILELLNHKPIAVECKHYIPKDPDGSSIASQILSKLHCGDEAFPFKVQMGILAARSPWIVTGSTWYAWGSRNCIEAPCLFFFVGIYWHSNIRVSRAFFVTPSFVFFAIHASQINQSCNTSQA